MHVFGHRTISTTKSQPHHQARWVKKKKQNVVTKKKKEKNATDVMTGNA